MQVYQYCWYFVIYSFLGWCVEVCFNSILTGKFVNRGFLNGAVCPIYGFGMCIVISCLAPISDNLILLYIGAVILTSSLEFVAGFVLKKVFGISWWDYSNVKFNLGGYICLSFSLAWGVGGVFAIKLIHPLAVWLVDFVPFSVGLVILIIVSISFIIDMLVTVNTIAKLNRDLGSLTQLADFLHKGSDSLAQSIGNEAIAASAQLEEGKEAMETKKVSALARFDMAKAEFADTKDFMRRRLIKAFPNMKTIKYHEALTQLKQWYDKK